MRARLLTAENWYSQERVAKYKKQSRKKKVAHFAAKQGVKTEKLKEMTTTTHERAASKYTRHHHQLHRRLKLTFMFATPDPAPTPAAGRLS